MALTNDRVREMKRLVDEHARKGDLRMTVVNEMKHSLSFSPTTQESEFLTRYAIWRLNHPITGMDVFKPLIPPTLLLVTADLLLELFPFCLA